MTFPAPDPELALRYALGTAAPEPLFAEARRLRDERTGRAITFSRKVFIPITTLCRDTCTYCTFAKPPGNGGEYLTPDDVLAIARAGDAHGCTEALLTLGDRPEDRWPQAREFLAEHECATTLEYVRAMAELIRSETALFPHANPGLMSVADMLQLRPTNPSMGLMLENASPRLMEPGMPHHDCPDKDPAKRLQTIEGSGEARVPFTTGVLVGIGETTEELVASLFVLADVARRTGSIQEVIVQNFRAKADIRMRRSPEPAVHYMVRIVAIARWILGSDVNLQVPPNLTADFGAYLDAGINDWGGVSPLTIDWVNPEAPWPHLDRLRAVTEASGYELRPRLPVYPEFIAEEWVDEKLLAEVRDAVDDRGYVRVLEGAA